MHNPTVNDSSFFIEIISGSKVHYLKSLNKEDHYEWGDVIYEVSSYLYLWDTRGIYINNINYALTKYILLKLECSC